MRPIHGEFELVRDVPVRLERIWQAYTDPAVRRGWRSVPGSSSTYAVDVVPGGSEHTTGRLGTEVVTSDATFLDVVPEQRIVTAYAVSVDDVRRWAGLATVTREADGDDTRITHHEQYAFLAVTGDGADDVAHLRGGVQLQLNRLQAVLD